jgi:hypothetical protein
MIGCTIARMDALHLIDSLERFASVLPAAVAGTSAEDARWTPPDGAWSILEIVCHLHDEEIRDFRTRLRLTLEEPTQDWPPIDPEAWARDEKYNERDLAEMAQRWLAERRASISWLRSLRNLDWSKSRTHPAAGTIHAGDLLTSWAAHDALHLRQIAKRMFQLAERDGAEFNSRYAGEWRA